MLALLDASGYELLPARYRAGMARLPPLRLTFWEGPWYLALAGLVGLTLCIVGFVVDLRSPSGHSPGAPWLLAGFLIAILSSHVRMVRQRRAERPDKDPTS